MKILKSFKRSILLSVVFALGLVALHSVAQAQPATPPWPATPGCDASNTNCHFDIRNNNDHGNGSLRLALDEGCKKAGSHLIEFGRFADSQTISLQTPLVIPSSCQGTFTIAGLQTKEVTLDGSAIARGQAVSSDTCMLYVGTGNHTIHHLTFLNAPFAVCLAKDNVKFSDNYVGIKRDGTVGANVTGLFIAGNSTQVNNNVFAGNSGDGIVIQGHQNKIEVNSIGVNSSNVDADKGNGGAGIRLIDASTQNQIGGDTNLSANVIRFNKAGGVVLAGTAESVRNKISHNRFSRNTGLGIDLKADGVTLPSAGGTGPNALLNMPTEVQTIPLETGMTHTRWMFRAKAPANASYVEIYLVDSEDSNDNAQSSGGKSYGEGDQLLVSVPVVHGTDGKFGVMIADHSLALGKKLSAIFRDDLGNTSEFSANIELKDKPNPDIPTQETVCGDGTIGGTEQCDDGSANGTTASCCDSTCHFKVVGTTCNDGTVGWCAGTSDTCNHNPGCGDGTVNGSEACDEGAANGTAASCCDAMCNFKSSGTVCNDGTPGVCDGSTVDCNHIPSGCGNGTVGGTEQCDDGAANGTAASCCSVTCTFKSDGTVCNDGTPGVCNGTTDTCNHPPAGCGNGTVGGTEQCDDGAANGTAASCCTLLCTFKSSGTVCNDGTPGVCSGTTDTCNHPPAGCGNGTVGGTEQCDDGAANGTAASCCSVTCTFKSSGTVCNDGSPGTCNGTTDVCNHGGTVCGDGTKSGSEQCDDGNMANGDGCDSTCHTEPGWTCNGASPTVCTHTCGNGVIDSGEACDDGNHASGDGCSSICQVEPGYTCNGTPSHCTNGGPLNPPTGLTGTADGPNRVTVTFTDNSDNETGFHVERADGPCGSSSVFTVVGTLPGSPGTGSTVVFVDNTVQPGQTYCYQATAFNNGNESGPSNSATVTTPNGGVGPVGPGGPMFLEGSGGCSLSPFGSETRDVFAIVTAMMGTLPISIVRWTRKKKN